jgi:hypothetical protein
MGITWEKDKLPVIQIRAGPRLSEQWPRAAQVSKEGHRIRRLQEEPLPTSTTSRNTRAVTMGQSEAG